MTEPPPNRLAWIGNDDPFPDVELAWTEELGANGLLAASEALSPEMLKRAYRLGVFPWSGPGEPVLWWTPNPRMVLQPQQFKLRRSLRQAIAQAQREGLRLTSDQDFAQVMSACAAPRPGQAGTWITPAIHRAYGSLHGMGLAHSVELWAGERLIGGLYLVNQGRMLFGESMFSRQPNASKICLAALVAWALRNDCPLIDCQQQTEHLATLGANPISRAEFGSWIARLVDQPPPPWDRTPIDWGVFETSHG